MVIASFSFASVPEIDDSIVNDPTAPWKSAGLGSGNGLTLTVTGSVATFLGTVDTDERNCQKTIVKERFLPLFAPGQAQSSRQDQSAILRKLRIVYES
jgi:hypothetical protein